MGKDAFLKLFVAQLSHQDPMNPMNDSEFMGQMASFSTLEQVSNLAAANEKIASQPEFDERRRPDRPHGHATSTTNDEIHTGTVEKVTTADGMPPSRSTASTVSIPQPSRRSLRRRKELMPR